MADGVFNRAKGAAAELIRSNPNKLVVMLMSAAAADASLSDYTDVAAMLAVNGNTEATFTNYERKTAIIGTVTIDNANDHVDCDVPDQTWEAAGGETNNVLAKAVVCVSTGTGDANLIPLSHHDFTYTTSGKNVVLKFNSNGFLTGN